MKRILIAAAVAAASFVSPAYAADVGVSINIGQPGFYGRLDIGGYPPPRVIYSRPRVMEYVAVERPPIYLRVPPRHIRHWGRHCREYGACGERVYFVRDDWYSRDYAPRYRERHGGYDRHGDGYRDNDRRGRGDGYRDNRDDRRGDERHDDHGRH